MSQKPIFVIGTSSIDRIMILQNELSNRFNLIVIHPDIDEKAIRDENPELLVTKIARAKLSSVIQKVIDQKIDCAYIISSDMVTVANNQIKEKPISVEENKEFVKSYSNNFIETISCTCMIHVSSNKIVEKIDRSKIYFNEIRDELIDKMIARKISMKCCGGFVIDDEDLKQCIKKIEGSINAIKGLDNNTVRQLFDQL